VVVLPAIGGSHIGAEVVIVKCAVELARATFGDHLHLSASGSVEIGGLIGDAYLKFFDAFNGRWHHTGDSSTVAGGVGGISPRHVVAVIAAIELEGTLVVLRPANLPAGRHADLQRDQ